MNKFKLKNTAILLSVFSTLIYCSMSYAATCVATVTIKNETGYSVGVANTNNNSAQAEEFPLANGQTGTAVFTLNDCAYGQTSWLELPLLDSSGNDTKQGMTVTIKPKQESGEFALVIGGDNNTYTGVCYTLNGPWYQPDYTASFSINLVMQGQGQGC